MPPSSRPIVLVVQTDRDTRVALRHAIELEGCATMTAASVADAYGMLAEHFDRIALLVLDISSNPAAAIALRQLQLDAARVAHIATVVVSDRPLTSDECAMLRPSGVLLKPLSLDAAIVAVPGDCPSGIKTAASAQRRGASPYRIH
jgi:DNA-binding NtrC family response regulator